MLQGRGFVWIADASCHRGGNGSLVTWRRSSAAQSLHTAGGGTGARMGRERGGAEISVGGAGAEGVDSGEVLPGS